MMVDEETTWFLGSCWGKFDISKIRGIVDLVTCGLFKIGVWLYLGGVICKKSSLFS